jgi:hypothetical protein
VCGRRLCCLHVFGNRLDGTGPAVSIAPPCPFVCSGFCQIEPSKLTAEFGTGSGILGSASAGVLHNCAAD